MTLLLLLTLLAHDPPREFYTSEAKRWTFYVDQARTMPATMVPKPVFVWSNELRAGGQHGACYVWTYEGRAVVFGGVLSNPEGDRRVVMHEFHALGPDRLFPTQEPVEDSKHEWLPGAGVEKWSLKTDLVPAKTAPLRKIQLRRLAREFTAHLTDSNGKRWQLRLLPKPVYEYDKPTGGVIDGAVWVMATDEGTDPEIVLCIEAVETAAGPAWEYRTVRFSMENLYVQRNGEQVWSSLRDDPTGPYGNPDNTFGVVRDRLIDELPDESSETE